MEETDSINGCTVTEVPPFGDYRAAGVSLVMFRYGLGRLVTEAAGVHRHVRNVPLARTQSAVQVSLRSFSEVKDEEQQFDTSLLDFLVCPLSKKPLR